MSELDRIREQIKRMRTKGCEPETVYMCYELWDNIGRKGTFFGICCCPSDKLIGRFEVR